MTTFSTGSGVGDNYAAILFLCPDVSWFKQNVLGAIDQMTDVDNWREDGDVGVSFAVEESEKMLETVKIMNFNPFPVGMIFPFGSDTTPDGYLACDGSSYVGTDYPELFTVIGTVYGGDSGNFNVPDLMNNVVVGSGGLYGAGDTGGESDHTLTIGEIATHSHIADAPTVIDPTHTHIEAGTIPTLITIGAGVPAPSAIPSPAITAPSLTGITVLAPNINNEGGGLPHNNLQPYLAVPYIIYAGR